MDAYQHLRHTPNNSRNNQASGMAPHNLANPPTLMNMTTTSGIDGMSLPMGMSMPPMGIPGMPSSDATVELTHMHRMNPLMNSAPIFPGVGTGRLSTMPTIPSIPTGTSSSKSQSKATAPVNANSDNSKPSKKRKAPSAISAVSTPDIDDDDKTGYEDPKAKRRAQIAKAARKHRQRQKDELIALRAKVKDLKEQIEVLQSSEPSEHNTEMGWKQEAEQHAAMRARVDQENEFLRKTLMEQMKFIQRLQDYFTKQPLLNMPSLDMILNTAASPSNTVSASSIDTSSMLRGAIPTSANSTSTISNGLSSFPSLQLPSMSFRDSLVQTAQEGISMIKNQLEQCEDSFRASKNPTMTYFGLQVQYEITKDDMGVFFRHQLYGMDAKSVAEKVWACIGDEAFDNQFPFVDVSEVLKDVDNDTKYMRRVINITASADNNTNASSSTVKEESLFVLHRAQTDDGKKVIVIRTIRNDPNRPQRHDYIRRNQCIIASFQDFKDPTGKGCLILYSVKVFIEKETNDRHNGANAPDIILRNLFEIMPTFVKALIDKARGNIPAPISNLH